MEGAAVIKLRKILTGAFLALALAGTSSPAQATSSKTHSKSVGAAKGVHVRSYRKKNGAVVKAYNRAAPKSKTN